MSSRPFDRDYITHHWHTLNWQHFAALDKESQRYLAFYGLDFQRQRTDLEQGFGYFRAAGFQIAVHAWRPHQARGTVLVCHGYFDHVGLYRHVIDYLLTLNYAVLAYDLPGHGLSSGPRVEIADFAVYRQVLEQCLALAEGHFPQPWHVVAQSTGGAIVMDYLLRLDKEQPNPFQQVILLAPLVRPFKWGTGRILHALARPFVATIKRVFTVNSSDPDFLDFIEMRDPLQEKRLSMAWISALKKWIPAFEQARGSAVSPIVIQGDQDETVEWRHNLAIIQDKFSRPVIHMLPGARHQLVNEAPAYRREMFRLIGRYLNV